VYDPTYWTNAEHLVPLLNANHLAAYLNLGLCCLPAMPSGMEPTMMRAIPPRGVDARRDAGVGPIAGGSGARFSERRWLSHCFAGMDAATEVASTSSQS
jgi:hypothetical protein